MKTKTAIAVFEVLTSEARLAIFRLLVKYAPNGLVAGDIARRLKVTNTNLSFHLKALLHAGLITMEKEGRFLRYRANIPVMLDTIAYLTAECCSGRLEECRGCEASSSTDSEESTECDAAMKE